MSENLYDILGVNKSASNEEIKKAYKKLAMKWHPDRNPSNLDIATHKFKKISDAYSILSDNKKKKNYDNFGFTNTNDADINPEDIFKNVFNNRKSSFNFNNFNNFDNGFDFDNIFNQFNDKNFNNFRKESYSFNDNQSKKITKEILIDLEDLYRGITKKIKITTSKLNGSKEEKVLDIPIKAGYKEGTKITYTGVGNEHLNSPPDDIIFVIKEKKHSMFRRDGNNLFLDLKIKFKDIINNKKIEIQTLDKKRLEFRCNFEDIDNWNVTKKIPNKGMPYRNKNNSLNIKYGDLILNIFVEFPQLNNYQKKIMNGIL